MAAHIGRVFPRHENGLGWLLLGTLSGYPSGHDTYQPSRRKAFPRGSPFTTTMEYILVLWNRIETVVSIQPH